VLHKSLKIHDVFTKCSFGGSMIPAMIQADAIPDWVIYILFTPFFPMAGFVHFSLGIIQVVVFLGMATRRWILTRGKDEGCARLFWTAYLPFFIVPNLVVIAMAPSISRWTNSGRAVLESRAQFGDPVDELNGVNVYYNGATSNTNGRSTSKDGYNFGLRYQCVEFVKRYYFERLGHRMPDTWGHAKDFFDGSVSQGSLNTARGLLQFRNGGSSPPKVEDLIVFGASLSNQYGHVAIVSEVNSGRIEITQQNAGPGGASRVNIGLEHRDGAWFVRNERVLGWLRASKSRGEQSSRD